MMLAFARADIKAAVAAAFTFIAESCSALATATWGRPGAQNLIWLIGIPVVTALVAFRSGEDRAKGAAALIVVGFAGTMAAAYFLPAGYR